MNSSSTQSEDLPTNFDLICEFNELFEADVVSVPDPHMFDTRPEVVDLRYKLIAEEFAELGDAIRDKNLVETVDALGDLLYVVYGAFDAFGVDADHTVELIHESNMSKMCCSEADAQETCEWYASQDQYSHFKPSYRQSNVADKWIVFDKVTNKILKSKYYKPVDLSSVLE